MAEMVKVPFLTKIPIDPVVNKAFAESGKSVYATHPESQVAGAFKKLVDEITNRKEL